MNTKSFRAQNLHNSKTRPASITVPQCMGLSSRLQIRRKNKMDHLVTSQKGGRKFRFTFSGSIISGKIVYVALIRGELEWMTSHCLLCISRIGAGCSTSFYNKNGAACDERSVNWREEVSLIQIIPNQIYWVFFVIGELMLWHSKGIGIMFNCRKEYCFSSPVRNSSKNFGSINKTNKGHLGENFQISSTSSCTRSKCQLC